MISITLSLRGILKKKSVISNSLMGREEIDLQGLDLHVSDLATWLDIGTPSFPPFVSISSRPQPGSDHS